MTYYILECNEKQVRLLVFDNYHACQNITMRKEIFEIWKNGKEEIDLHRNLMNDIIGEEVY